MWRAKKQMPCIRGRINVASDDLADVINVGGIRGKRDVHDAKGAEPRVENQECGVDVEMVCDAQIGSKQIAGGAAAPGCNDVVGHVVCHEVVEAGRAPDTEHGSQRGV